MFFFRMKQKIFNTEKKQESYGEKNEIHSECKSPKGYVDR